MSGLPISASDLPRRGGEAFSRLRQRSADPEILAALPAGWHRAENEWERTEEQALIAWAAGERLVAATLWRRGWLVARRRFTAEDPRRATALANAGLADLVAGRRYRARRRVARARRLWAAVPDWVARTGIRPMARSSLFHLRMETRHRETFAANARDGLIRHALEAIDRLDRLAAGALPDARPDRWRRDRPRTLDDRRRLMAAVLLLAA